MIRFVLRVDVFLLHIKRNSGTTCHEMDGELQFIRDQG